MDNIYHRDQAQPTAEELDELTLFIRKNYYWGLGFMLTSVGVWLLLMACKWYPHRYMPFPTYVLVLIVFLVMVTLNCIPQTAYCSPCKWLMAAIVVICTTVAGCGLTEKVGTGNACLVMGLVALVILILNFSGSKCPQEFLPGGVLSTMLMILLLAVLACVGVAQLITGSEELLHAFVSILFIMVVIAILIQAQFNHGRLDDVVEVYPKHHQLICILTLYLHTMMFLFCVYYFIVVEEQRKYQISLTSKDDSGKYLN